MHGLIPTPPPSGMTAALAERPIRQAVETPLATFLPTSYEPGYSYPLVIWLHETGHNERHLTQVMQYLSTQNYVSIAPRGPSECSAVKRGFRWGQRPQCIAAADDAVNEAVEFAKEQFSIHSQRVFLVGHGSGGTMALRLALQYPERFAGVASLAGPMPRSHSPLKAINKLRQLPIFLAAAREYPAYPEARVCRDLRLLHSAGCSVALRQYPGDDDLTTCMLADVNRWLMGQVCGT